MKSFVIKLFSFDELPEESKKNAIKQYETEWEYLDLVYEDIKYNLLPETGLTQIIFEYSYSFSQGDGCCFTGVFPHEMTMEIIKEEDEDLFNHLSKDEYDFEIDAVIEKINHRYCHERTVSVSADLSPHGKTVDAYLISRLEEKIENILYRWVESKCYDYYQLFDNEYYRITEESFVIERLQEFDAIFLENGNMASHDILRYQKEGVYA